MNRHTTLRRAAIIVAIAYAALCASRMAFAQEPKDAANSIDALDVSSNAGKITVKLTFKEALQAVPAGFAITNPPRISFDFPNTRSGLGKATQEINEGDLKAIRVGQAAGRTRVVFNLIRALKYDAQLDGKNLVITLEGEAQASSSSTTHFADSKPTAQPHSVRDIDFRRGRNGEGQIVIDLSDSTTGIDLRQQGKSIVVEFPQTALPQNLERRYDVTDYATAVDFFEVTRQGSLTRIVVQPKGKWEQSAYQTDNRFVIEVKTIIEDPTRLVQKTGYKGEKLSLNFQNVEVRAVLQVIADFTGLNVVTSDTVSGSLTLRLKDVPWDQALDIILQSKGLDSRKNGSVVWIAPREEMATKEKLSLEAQQQISELEPLRTESFQLNYMKAEIFQKMLSEGTQKMLSKRGTAIVDQRTNTLFLNDIESKLEEVRALIKRIDIPTRQVLIESRIVEANDTFSRNLGARLGVHDQTGQGSSLGGDSHRVVFGGNLADSGFHTGQTITTPDFIRDSMAVNLPANVISGVNPAAFSMILMNGASNRFLNLELSALQADGKGKVISSPRVITGDNVEALIEQGTEIPYTTTAPNGASTITFRKAVLSLKVRPQITPDENVIMKLEVHKDTRGTDTPIGPAIDTKQVLTEVLVENGGTVGIGGIYTQDEQSTINKVPLLGDIPLIGFFFRNEQKHNDKKELLIFVTPKVLKDTLTSSAR
jgi:type IV pilus assembly protein PilQ